MVFAVCFGLYHRLKDETKDVCIYVCIDTYVMQPLLWVGLVGGDHIYLSICQFIRLFIYYCMGSDWDYIDASRNNRYTGILLTIEE